MKIMTEIKLRYFSCKPGHVVPRWGVGGSYICSVRTPTGYVFNEGEVVAIPEIEIRRFWREYSNGIKAGSLIEKKKADYDAYIEENEKKVKAAAKKDKKNKDKPGRAVAGDTADEAKVEKPSETSSYKGSSKGKKKSGK
jgi:hypothetical protein